MTTPTYGRNTGATRARDPISGQPRRSDAPETIKELARKQKWVIDADGPDVLLTKGDRCLLLRFYDASHSWLLSAVLHSGPNHCGMSVDPHQARSVIEGLICTCATEGADNGLDLDPSPDCPLTHPRELEAQQDRADVGELRAMKEARRTA